MADVTKQCVELLFDGANGPVSNRLDEIAWERVFGAEYDACCAGECDCERECDEPVNDETGSYACGDCDGCLSHRDDARSELLDDLIAHPVFVAHRKICDTGALEVARDVWLEKRPGDRTTLGYRERAMDVLRADGYEIYTFDLRDGDLFLVPENWECNDRGAWHPRCSASAPRSASTDLAEFLVKVLASNGHAQFGFFDRPHVQPFSVRCRCNAYSLHWRACEATCPVSDAWKSEIKSGD